MGEITNAMQDGTLCADCGVFLDFQVGCTELAYSLYTLQFENMQEAITREDLELINPADIDETAESMKEKNIVDWEPYGLPLLCEDCYNNYVENSVVKEVRAQVNQNLSVFLRFHKDDDFDKIAEIYINSDPNSIFIQHLETIELEDQSVNILTFNNFYDKGANSTS